jgi:hypothetical protein
MLDYMEIRSLAKSYGASDGTSSLQVKGGKTQLTLTNNITRKYASQLL